MTYRVTITKPATKALAKINQRDRGRIAEAIRSLADDPRPAGCKSLTNRDGYRIRIGTYRVIYRVADDVQIVTVTKVGHRREVYQ